MLTEEDERERTGREIEERAWLTLAQNLTRTLTRTRARARARTPNPNPNPNQELAFNAATAGRDKDTAAAGRDDVRRGGIGSSSARLRDAGSSGTRASPPPRAETPDERPDPPLEPPRPLGAASAGGTGPTGTASAPTLRGRAGYASGLIARPQGPPAADGER